MAAKTSTRAHPIQVWMPFLWVSPLNDIFSRDWLRAQREWHGEEHVWLDPDAQDVKRWMHQEEDGFPEHACLIPSEAINGFSILHIDEGRRVHPLFPFPDEWQNVLPEGLYRQWLSTLPDIVEGRASLSLVWPIVTEKAISYGEREIQLAPGPILPITWSGENDGTFTAAWPPPNTMKPRSISPEMESKQLYGPLNRATVNIDGKAIDIVVSERNSGVRAFNIWHQWRKPFDVFFPIGGGGSDLLLHHAMMKKCIKRVAEGQRDEAIRISETWVNSLTGEAEAELYRAWFMPKAWTDTDMAFIDTCERFGLDFPDLDTLVCSKRFQEIMSSKIMVRRVQGWLGYFWWELYQDIITEVTLRFCRQCGNILRGGHADRMYCLKEENPDCYRKRNAQQQRKKRRKSK